MPALDVRDSGPVSVCSRRAGRRESNCQNRGAGGRRPARKRSGRQCRDRFFEDDEGNPLENALVSFAPNVVWFNGSAGLLGQHVDSLTVIRAELAAGKRLEWNAPEKDYSAKTDARGMAVVRDLPSRVMAGPGAAVICTFNVFHDDCFPAATWDELGRRNSGPTIRLVPGETGTATVRLKKR